MAVLRAAQLWRLGALLCSLLLIQGGRAQDEGWQEGTLGQLGFGTVSRRDEQAAS